MDREENVEHRDDAGKSVPSDGNAVNDEVTDHHSDVEEGVFI